MPRFLAPAAAALLFSVMAAAADAASAPPPIAYGSPFSMARAELATAGFVPARIVWRARGRDCGDGAKCWATGPVYCYVALGVCRWLFVNRANNALYFVDTSKLPRLDGSVPLGEYRAMWLATQGELEWHNIEIVLPNGVHRRFVQPPRRPPPPEPPTPLCSQVPPHTLPCWVKPPPGYRVRP